MRFGTNRLIQLILILSALSGSLTLNAKTDNISQSSFFRQTDTEYYWDDAAANWILYGQTISTFNNSDQIIEKLEQDWSGFNWTNSKRNVWTYDNSGYLIGELLETWSYSDEQWQNYSKIEYTNDSNGNQIERTVIEYHEIPGFTQLWWNKYHSTYTYDTANRLIETINQTWSSNHWSNDDRYTYTYDSNGKLTVILDEGWYFSTWLNENLTTYSYNSAGVEQEILFQHWGDPDYNGSYEWTNYRREQHSIDVNSNIDGVVWEKWESNRWQYKDRKLFTFDEDFNITETLYQVWNTSTNYWLNSEHTLTTYQNWGTIADFTADTQSGQPPLTVQFTDLSFQAPEGNPILSWAWDFNDDGIIDATSQNPGYTYTSPGSYSVTLIVSDGTTADTLKKSNYISVLNNVPEPNLTITDIPNDEGGELLISFTASSQDAPPLGWNDRYDVYTLRSGDTVWTMLTTIPATGAGSYSLTFSTAADSGDIHEVFLYYFFVTAVFNNYYYYSEYQWGYSLDNIAPAATGNLNAVINGVSVQLAWDSSSELDFDYYIIYRANTASMNNPQLLAETDLTTYTDADISLAGDYYYQVAAVDIHGNQSAENQVAYVEILTAVDAAALPAKFTLHRNYPNPFNPATTFKYSLPIQQLVNLSLYDLNGRLIETLINSEKPAGTHQIKWDASAYGSGIYLYRFDAGEYHKSGRCILIK